MLPVAISRWVCVFASLSTGSEHLTVSDDDVQPQANPFAQAVLNAITPGISYKSLVISNLPVGSGLSSSAAFSTAYAVIANRYADTPRPPMELAKICQQAEHDVLGVPCGLMDPVACLCGRAEQAVLFNTQFKTRHVVRIPPKWQIVLMNSGVPRTLGASAYSQRAAECKLAAQQLGVRWLADASLKLLMREAEMLDPVAFRRARHVVTETKRVQDFERALDTHDSLAAGEVMQQSHDSLRDDLEVSCLELDTLVRIAQGTEGCIGARMTGAGFGGHAVALVWRERVATFCQSVDDQYRAATHRNSECMAVEAVHGAQVGTPDEIRSQIVCTREQTSPIARTNN